MTDTDARRIDLEIEISDPATETRALVAPNRGGMVTALSVRSRAVLFLDRATFLDPAKNVRGGNPVLFPTPGKLVGDRWSRDGRSGSLGQHGFARSLPWSVVTSSTDAVTLRLEADETTRANYPWDFAIDLSYTVGGQALRIEARIENRSSTAMPFGFGFHPYFAVKDKRTLTAETRATRAFDNVTKREAPFDARTLDLGTAEIDLHLLDHGERHFACAFDDITRLTIDGATERPHWVLWSLPGRDFVCVEPWTCPGDAMNTGERLTELPSGESVALSFSYRVEMP